MEYGTSIIHLLKYHKSYFWTHQELRKKYGNFRYDQYGQRKNNRNTVAEESISIFHFRR